MRVRSALIAFVAAALFALGFVSTAVGINHFNSWNETHERGTKWSDACIQGNNYPGHLVNSLVNNCSNRVYLQGGPHNPWSWCVNPKTTIDVVPSQYTGPRGILIGRALQCGQ